MKKVNTYSEMKEERKRLLMRQAELELAIKSDFQELKEELDPGHIIAKVTGKLIMNKGQDVLGFSAGALSSFIVKKILLRKSGFLTKIAAGFIARNYGANLFEEKKDIIFNWASSLLKKIKKSKPRVPDQIFTNIGYQ